VGRPRSPRRWGRPRALRPGSPREGQGRARDGQRLALRRGALGGPQGRRDGLAAEPAAGGRGAHEDRGGSPPRGDRRGDGSRRGRRRERGGDPGPGAHPLHLGQHGRAQGRCPLACSADLRQSLLDRSRHGPHRRGRGAGGAAPVALLRPQRRAPRAAPGRGLRGSPRPLLAGGRTVRHRAAPRDRVPRSGRHVPEDARCPGDGDRRPRKPPRGGVGGGSVSVGAGAGVAGANRRQDHPRLRLDGAVPPHLSSRRRSLRRARVGGAARARRRDRRRGRCGRGAAAGRGRRAVDPDARRHAGVSRGISTGRRRRAQSSRTGGSGLAISSPSPPTAT